MEKINGKEIAEKIYSRIGSENGGLKLAVIMAGADKATESFVAQKKKAALKTGVDFELLNFPADTTTKELSEVVKRASDNPEITAIVTQLPFPPQVDKREVLSAISRQKDADSLNGGDLPAPAVGTVIEILSHLNKDISSINLSVIGYGELVGKPVYDYFSGRAKSATLSRRGSDLSSDLKDADAVVSGAGKFGLITPDMLKDGAIVIDFGYGMDENGNMGGDFNPEESDKNIVYTPTPGGTGPILVAKLFENIVSIGK